MEPMTRENLKAAFSKECQAHIKYLAFAQQAEQDGYPNVARVFRAIAASEKRHAMRHLEKLDEVGSTDENLREAYETENHEVGHMYPAFSAVARLEGEEDADDGYRQTLEVQKHHLPLYDEAEAAVAAGEDVDGETICVCSVCGRTVRGEAPERCPVCNTPGDQFEVY